MDLSELAPQARRARRTKPPSFKRTVVGDSILADSGTVRQSSDLSSRAGAARSCAGILPNANAVPVSSLLNDVLSEDSETQAPVQGGATNQPAPKSYAPTEQMPLYFTHTVQDLTALRGAVSPPTKSSQAGVGSMAFQSSLRPESSRCSSHSTGGQPALGSYQVTQQTTVKASIPASIEEPTKQDTQTEVIDLTQDSDNDTDSDLPDYEDVATPEQHSRDLLHSHRTASETRAASNSDGRLLQHKTPPRSLAHESSGSSSASHLCRGTNLAHVPHWVVPKRSSSSSKNSQSWSTFELSSNIIDLTRNHEITATSTQEDPFRRDQGEPHGVERPHVGDSNKGVACGQRDLAQMVQTSKVRDGTQAARNSAPFRTPGGSVFHLARHTDLTAAQRSLARPSSKEPSASANAATPMVPTPASFTEDAENSGISELCQRGNNEASLPTHRASFSNITSNDPDLEPSQLHSREQRAKDLFAKHGLKNVATEFPHLWEQARWLPIDQQSKRIKEIAMQVKSQRDSGEPLQTTVFLKEKRKRPSMTGEEKARSYPASTSGQIASLNLRQKSSVIRAQPHLQSPREPGNKHGNSPGGLRGITEPHHNRAFEISNVSSEAREGFQGLLRNPVHTKHSLSSCSAQGTAPSQRSSLTSCSRPGSKNTGEYQEEIQALTIPNRKIASPIKDHSRSGDAASPRKRRLTSPFGISSQQQTRSSNSAPRPQFIPPPPQSSSSGSSPDSTFGLSPINPLQSPTTVTPRRAPSPAISSVAGPATGINLARDSHLGAQNEEKDNSATTPSCGETRHSSSIVHSAGDEPLQGLLCMNQPQSVNIAATDHESPVSHEAPANAPSSDNDGADGSPDADVNLGYRVVSLAESLRQERLRGFSSAALDLAIYAQPDTHYPRGLTFPLEVLHTVISLPSWARNDLNANPVIHGMHPPLEPALQAAKDAEIAGRGRRKFWFGKVGARQRYRLEKERNTPSYLRTRSVCRRRDIGFLEEHELPPMIVGNEQYVKYWRWFRDERKKALIAEVKKGRQRRRDCLPLI
ncbi:hypothetical protein NLU13_7460 [Sarocladium strictum]|uniref:Uncharacterized protein n=1 Tax=Sarocladium strictum TaxID=5046 RepID=A0AA39GCU9_SARSR|nr:hypothetical protein NLU13_7460 [Sarocladium strictum]